eukprot:GHVU01223494.1.p1 GENE.GHVU01223494.1~~GHVU01223494.1.p1  ORF type:complete len:154 (-),score=3.22 GHVU01223494.1:186-647(-)
MYYRQIMYRSYACLRKCVYATVLHSLRTYYVRECVCAFVSSATLPLGSHSPAELQQQQQRLPPPLCSSTVVSPLTPPASGKGADYKARLRCVRAVVPACATVCVCVRAVCSFFIRYSAPRLPVACQPAAAPADAAAATGLIDFLFSADAARIR